MKTLILTQEEIETILTMEAAVPAVERAFAAHGRGEAIMPPKLYLPLEKYRGDFRAMPVYLEGTVGIKWVNMHPENPARHGLPSVLATYILSDPATAAPLAVMDATSLTAFRTGAAAAVASRHLAVKAPRTIGFVGCGVQARSILAAHRVLYEGLLVTASDVSSEAAEAFASETGGKAAAIDRAASCEIVCTVTPSRSPVVHRAFVGVSTHFNAMGADAPGKQELDPAILQEAKVVLDDLEQATESGEVNVPLHDGSFRRDQIYGTLGEIVAGKKKGREGPEITVFDSTGLAVQDLALARVVYDEALRRGMGTTVELIRG